MGDINKYLVFDISDKKFALPLTQVERVIQVVEINSLPQAPDFVMGVMNYYDEFIPVINLRKLFVLYEKSIELADHLIIAKTHQQMLALWIDSPGDVIEILASEIVSADKFYYENQIIKGLLKSKDETILIQNLDQILNVKEIELLKKALGQLEKHKANRT